MYKYILGIDGMRCGMCEVHIEEAITKEIKVKKIKASRYKNNVIIITELELNEDDFHNILDSTGYRITYYRKEEAIKGFFGWK